MDAYSFVKRVARPLHSGRCKWTELNRTELNCNSSVQFGCVVRCEVMLRVMLWVTMCNENRAQVVRSRRMFLQIWNWRRVSQTIVVQFSCIARWAVIVTGCFLLWYILLFATKRAIRPHAFYTLTQCLNPSIGRRGPGPCHDLTTHYLRATRSIVHLERGSSESYRWNFITFSRYRLTTLSSLRRWLHGCAIHRVHTPWCCAIHRLHTPWCYLKTQHAYLFYYTASRFPSICSIWCIYDYSLYENKSQIYAFTQAKLGQLQWKKNDANANIAIIPFLPYQIRMLVCLCVCMYVCHKRAQR
jgi:hypothetical protein